ncbi:MAG: hypothetical protein WBA77_06985 [Microcoleaceae cyanobacterium]
MKVKKLNQWSWWSKLVALITLANFLLVLFNLSYISFRDIYFKQIPSLVRLYDPVKGIEPHPDTTQYLDTVDSLTVTLSQNQLSSPSTEVLLASLRQQSEEILLENPFSAANKFGTFAKLKRRIESYVNATSARQGFTTFWSQDYLNQVGTAEALRYFNQQIRPLMEVNYYRGIDDNGQYIDKFLIIDLYFILFFAIEYLSRTLWYSIKTPNTNWLDALLRRWYDAILLIPAWRWLRIIPLSVRLHKSGLVNMERVLAQTTHEPAAYLADRVSTFLMVRLINQAKESIETGEMTQSLLNSSPYVQVSNIDKIDAITDRILQLTIYKVLPQVKPDLELLLRHSLAEAVQGSDLYKGLQQIPGIAGIPADTLDQFSDYLATTTCDVLASSYADLEGRERFEQLVGNFKQVLRQELQDEKTQAELQKWMSDWLEELKINYVQKSNQPDPEQTLDEAEQLRDASNSQTLDAV